MAERDQLRMPLVRRLIGDDVLGAAHFCTIRIGVLSRAWLIMVSVPWRLVVAIRDHVCGEGGGRHRHGSECCNQKSFRDCGHGCSPGVDQTQENALYTGGVPDGRIYFLATVALKKMPAHGGQFRGELRLGASHLKRPFPGEVPFVR